MHHFIKDYLAIIVFNYIDTCINYNNINFQALPLYKNPTVLFQTLFFHSLTVSVFLSEISQSEELSLESSSVRQFSRYDSHFVRFLFFFFDGLIRVQYCQDKKKVIECFFFRLINDCDALRIDSFVVHIGSTYRYSPVSLIVFIIFW